MVWFWIFVGPALALAAAALWGERARATYVADELANPPLETAPPASIIVPVGRESSGLRDTLRALAAQDYPDYEVLVAAERAELIPPDALPSRAVVFLGQAPPENGPNGLLMLAVRATRKNAQILAFTTAGTECSGGWLRALVAPLSRDRVGASTGYRWYLPDPPDFWSLMRSVWNAPIAGLLGPCPAPSAWCGAMAIRKETFLEARVPEFWKEGGDGGDGLTRAIHAAGLTVAFAPGGVVALRDRVSASGFFRAAVAEMAELQRSHPRLWWSGLAYSFLQCGAMTAAITASIMGNRLAEWALVALWGLTMLKGTNYVTIAKAELPGHKTWFDRHAWVHSIWVPLAMWVWLAVLIFSLGPRNKRV